MALAVSVASLAGSCFSGALALSLYYRSEGQAGKQAENQESKREQQGDVPRTFTLKKQQSQVPKLLSSNRKQLEMLTSKSDEKEEQISKIQAQLLALAELATPVEELQEHVRQLEGQTDQNCRRLVELAEALTEQIKELETRLQLIEEEQRASFSHQLSECMSGVSMHLRTQAKQLGL
mmetsp:Transcript_12921/g.29472  ORF Transcript_12921/g.29472 Transcript_12921/m.29472 type:complete len:178 (-) Transcript_12921:286-819(-)